MNYLNKKYAPPKRGTRVTSNILPLYQTLSILSIGTGKAVERTGWL